MAIYKGFSTANESASVTLLDTDLIKQDLLNVLKTRQGERLMRGDYGCGVWNYIHEPLDDATKDAVVTELRRVVSLDPRLQLIGVRLQDYEHGLQVVLELNYVNLQATELLFVEFDSRNNSINSATITQ
jgi:phage baseplate assembly protein W